MSLKNTTKTQKQFLNVLILAKMEKDAKIIVPEEIRHYTKGKKREIKKIPEENYSLYQSNQYSKIANMFLEKLTYKIIKKYKFQSLGKALELADIKLLFRTYVAMMFFSTLLALPFFFLMTFLFTSNLVLSISSAFLGALITYALIYAYPYSLINQRKRIIKTDLVFATVHMAAIAGSGAPPIKIFTLLLESKDYKGLDSELKKILNYINLFGYNLSTALRSVASSTPSYELKELLNGMVSTIETGGDLKKYLKDKADDSLITYRLDQQKYVATLSTYSDVYTGILVTAPLLFLVTLAILDKISPSLGGISIGVIAALGTYVLLPVINIAFIIFLNITQPEL